MQSTPSPMDSLAAFALAYLAGVFTALLWMAYLESAIEDASYPQEPDPPPDPHTSSRLDVGLFQTRIQPLSQAFDRSEMRE